MPPVSASTSKTSALIPCSAQGHAQAECKGLFRDGSKQPYAYAVPQILVDFPTAFSIPPNSHVCFRELGCHLVFTPDDVAQGGIPNGVRAQILLADNSEPITNIFGSQLNDDPITMYSQIDQSKKQKFIELAVGMASKTQLIDNKGVFDLQWRSPNGSNGICFNGTKTSLSLLITFGPASVPAKFATAIGLTGLVEIANKHYDDKLLSNQFSTFGRGGTAVLAAKGKLAKKSPRSKGVKLSTRVVIPSATKKMKVSAARKSAHAAGLKKKVAVTGASAAKKSTKKSGFCGTAGEKKKVGVLNAKQRRVGMAGAPKKPASAQRKQLTASARSTPMPNHVRRDGRRDKQKMPHHANFLAERERARQYRDGWYESDDDSSDF